MVDITEISAMVAAAGVLVGVAYCCIIILERSCVFCFKQRLDADDTLRSLALDQRV